MIDIAELLKITKEKGASDLHITTNVPPMLRIHGELYPLPNFPPLTASQVHEIIYGVLSDYQRKLYEENKELDFAIEIENVARFRVNAFLQKNGEAAVFRIIPTRVKTLKELGLPEILAKLTHKPKGLILVTGPTGSGKSTTLAAMIDYINENFRHHIITIEDPIEFVHPHKKSIVNQRELGSHTKSFANALRSALREDPDVILVGEMRDLETISLALTAAETGHLVFATLHTMSAAKTVDRIIDVFPAGQQSQIRAMFAESIVAVISQTLVPKIDKSGRVAALEIMIGTSAIKSLIREGKTHQIPSAIQTGHQYGMVSLDQYLKELYIRKIISKEEAVKRAINPQLFY